MKKFIQCFWVMTLLGAFASPVLAEKNDAKQPYARLTPASRLDIIQQWQPTTEIEKLQKEALLAEGKNDYQAACKWNQEIASRSDASKAAIGAAHLGLQRCYEQTGDLENEKEELRWVYDNILFTFGQYREVISQMTSDTVNYLKERKEKLLGVDKVEKDTKDLLAKQGYKANVQRSGNTVFVGPTYYEKGKDSISELEKRVYEEYASELKKRYTATMTSEEKQKHKDKVAMQLVAKYRMTPENFVYLVLKILYNEVPPETYVPPTK